MVIQAFKRILAKFPNHSPLRVVLVGPLVLQLVGVVGLVGYLSFRNGQQAINDVATQLRQEIILQIQSKLNSYIETAHNLNHLNAITLVQGDIDVANAKGEHIFWQQMQIFPTASFIYCGDKDGNLYGVGRVIGKPSLLAWESNRSTNYIPYYYSLDPQGNRTQALEKDTRTIDPRVRPWYKAAVAAGGPAWSDIYLIFTTLTPAIAASIPVYSPTDHSLIGVCATDFYLPKEMSEFFRSLNIGKTGSAFIVERSGQLVSTSTSEPMTTGSGENTKRLFAVQSSNAAIRATSEYLRDRFGDLHQIQAPQQLDLNINGEQQFVDVVPFKDGYGLDWLIVTVVPQADFMEQIQRNTQHTILLCIAALIGAATSSVLTARWITQPVLHLNQSAKALAKGEWQQTANIERSDELGELAKSFNSMAQQLQTSFDEMRALNQALSQNESRLKQFLDAIPLGISVIDANGKVCYVNQKTYELCNIDQIPETITPEFLQQIHLYQTGTNHLYPVNQLPIVRSLTGDTVNVSDMEFRHLDRTIALEVSSTPIFDEMGNAVYALAAFQDITERKQAEQLLADYNRTLEQQVAERTLRLKQLSDQLLEQNTRLADEVEERKRVEAALRQKEATNQAIISAIPDLLIHMDQQGNYLGFFVSRDFKLYNPQQERIGANIYDVLPQEIAEERIKYIHKALETGELQVFENQLVLDGVTHYQETRIIANGEEEVLIIVRDFSDRKRAEEASILEERNRMAREIHDTLAQAFTGILVQVGAVSQVIADDLEATQAHLEIIDELARSGLAEARRSVAALRPQLLEHGNLYSALYRLVTQMRAATDTVLICEARGAAYALPAEVENNLLRIGQEALTNAIKHAQASEILVELAYEDIHCILRIKDNGRGFGVGSISGSGFGLLGMSERAEHIGAQLKIQSHPNQGTEIIVTIDRA